MIDISHLKLGDKVVSPVSRADEFFTISDIGKEFIALEDPVSHDYNLITIEGFFNGFHILSNNDIEEIKKHIEKSIGYFKEGIKINQDRLETAEAKLKSLMEE